MKAKHIDYYMNIADLTSKLSYAKRLQVGAVIVRDHQILGTGYNGTPTGWDNVCEELVPGQELIDIKSRTISHYPEQLKTKPEVIHAEMNSLMKVTRSTESSDRASMFCTHAPCMDCAKAIYQSGITTLYYRETYRDDAGINFLIKSGVNVIKYKPNS